MATERYRMRFDFQLNVAKEEEYAIAGQIKSLKEQGLYSKTVRDGIRLVCDLREGNLDVLFDLFPWVRAEFLEYLTSTQSQKSETETEIQRQLEQIAKLLSSSPIPASSDDRGGPKKLTSVAPSMPMTQDDVDDLLVMKKAKSKGDSAKNFLDSAFNLVQ